MLSSASVSANDTTVSNVSVAVPASCNITTNNGSGQTYNVSVLNGQYKNDIGKTRLNVFCNTKDTFAIYAVGYSNDTVGNNEMVAGTSGVSNITTGTATSGDTSNWAMKVEAVDGAGVSGEHVSHTPTILSPFNDFTGIPDAWVKVAEVTSVNGKTNGAAIDASYAIYVAPKQAAASYQGKVRYTVVHPASVDPSAGQANLDTGSNINKKLKSLANGTNVTDTNTSDTLITAFVRSDTLPANFTPSNTNTISTTNSLTPVYVWFDSTDGAMYYYSKAGYIYMNSNSNSLFHSMKSLADISGLKYFIADNVTDMGYMFRYTQISDFAPLKDWKVDNATSAFIMFHSTQISDLTPLANWNVSNVTNMSGMFATTQISDLAPIANWNVGNVKIMSEMFTSIPTLTNATPIEVWDVRNVVDNNPNTLDAFDRMFGGSTPKTNLPIFTSRPGTWDANGTYIPNP